MALTLVNDPIDQYQFADNPIWIIVESDQYTGATPPFEPEEPNQRIILYVFTFKPGFVEVQESRLSLAISPITKQAYASISPLIDLKLVPPDPATILTGMTTELYPEPEGWRLYQVKAYEQSGLPPVENSEASLEIGEITGEDTLYAIKGGLPLDAVNLINPINTTTSGKLLHVLLSNIHQDTLPISNISDLIFRPATKEMPSWMYIFLVDSNTFDIKVTVAFSNGATDTHTFTNRSGDPGINYIPVGWDQMDLDTRITVPAGTKPIFYSIQVTLLDEDVGFTMLFQLHECPVGTRYLLMETGLGGLETIPFFGKTSTGSTSSRETTRLSTTPDTTAQTGTYANLNTQTNRTFLGRTGYYPRNYIELLSQLICGELWEIDLKGGRFLKIAADQSSFTELAKDDEELYALEFRYRQGWDDPHSLKI